MSNYDKEYVRERMNELEKKARAHELARRCMAMKKKQKQRKSLWIVFRSYLQG